MVLHAPRTGQNVKYDPIDSMPFQLRAGLRTCPTPRPEQWHGPMRGLTGRRPSSGPGRS